MTNQSNGNSSFPDIWFKRVIAILTTIATIAIAVLTCSQLKLNRLQTEAIMNSRDNLPKLTFLKTAASGELELRLNNKGAFLRDLNDVKFARFFSINPGLEPDWGSYIPLDDYPIRPPKKKDYATNPLLTAYLKDGSDLIEPLKKCDLSPPLRMIRLFVYVHISYQDMFARKHNQYFKIVHKIDLDQRQEITKPFKEPSGNVMDGNIGLNNLTSKLMNPLKSSDSQLGWDSSWSVENFGRNMMSVMSRLDTESYTVSLDEGELAFKRYEDSKKEGDIIKSTQITGRDLCKRLKKPFGH